MLFKDISILDENFAIKNHMTVCVKKDKIEWIRPAEEAKTAVEQNRRLPEPQRHQVYNGSSRLLLPGFVNGHSHLPMTILRGYGENLSLHNWLNDCIIPFEDCFTEKDVYNSTLLGIAEMLRFGITSTSEMYCFLPEIFRAVDQSGIKCNLSRASSSTGDKGYYGSIAHRENEIIWQQYHNSSNGRIMMNLSAHAEYTSNEKFIRELAEYSLQLGARVQIHASETKAEHEQCKQRHHGLTPIQYFNNCGLLDSPVSAAHCVWLEDEDFSILREKGASVVSCPKSNLKLASGIADIPRMLRSGINVAIGTDSVASNNNVNMLEEIKFFSLIYKGKTGDPTVISPSQAMYAATAAGAQAQGRYDCGVIKEGCKADLIVLDICAPYMQPVHNLLNNVIYSACGTDIVLTMVDGKVLYKDGVYTTIDLENVTAETQNSRLRILKELAGKQH